MLTINLPASKSLSNRYLILQALSQNAFTIHNLSTSEDTQLLKAALIDQTTYKYVGDGGTTLRFLLPFLAVQATKKLYVIETSSQLKKRPIIPLLDVLKQLGADILQSDIPIHLVSNGLSGKEIVVDTILTSQFVSALLLVAPFLQKPLTLVFKSPPVSYAYIQMTLGVLNQFQVFPKVIETKIRVEPKALNFNIKSIKIENDWSAASYWYLLLSFSKYDKLYLPLLWKNSLQGDSRIAEFALILGIQTIYRDDGIELKKSPILLKPSNELLIYDVKSYPDLIPTLLIWLSLLKQDALMIGVNSLLYKESNRINALQFNFKKIGIDLEHDFENDQLVLKTQHLKIPTKVAIDSFNDHRIAMAFSILHLLTCVEIYDLNCVKKSYPDFWHQFEQFIH